MVDRDRGEREAPPSLLSSFLAYPRLLFENRAFLALFLASVFQQLGAWTNLIASLKVIEAHGTDKSGVHTAVVFFLRNTPSVCLFPITGYFADRYDRRSVMLGSNFVSALVAAAFVFLTFVEDNLQLVLLCVLIFTKNACSAFYDPCKVSGLVCVQCAPTDFPFSALPFRCS